MANRAKVLQVVSDDLEVLRAQVRAKSSPAKVVERARIVLLAAEGLPADEIAERIGCSRPTVVTWRQRYERGGIEALADAPRSGAPPSIPEQVKTKVLTETLKAPPRRLGITHWSSRLLARHVGDISHMAVARIWQQWGVQPWRSESFRFSTDPELAAKVEDIVGLYLHPPEGAVVLCIDEKSQIQALERAAPILPLRPGLAERQSHDYYRHGTTTLFAALDIATGKVTDACYPRHTGEQFLAFLKLVAKTYPRRELHVVLDNYSTHKRKDITDWLERNPRITFHFTPTHSSWMNLVEVFFSIITRQAIRRGSFRSVKELMAAIRRYIDGWNERCEPFAWTKSAEEILAKANRQTESVTED
jgi:transposase